MKKILLCSAALVGVAFAAAPAMAQVDVTVGGHTKNYMGYLTQDDTAATTEERNFDMLRESEIHFNAEGTADNGLTYGFHVETEADGADSLDVEESYLYLASNLGRVNLGSEDGAQYLLQVAAPSADANVDGLRQYINPINASLLPGGVSTESDYDADEFDTDVAEKVTYLSPNWSGFQFGLSYTPEGLDDIGTGLGGFNVDEQEDNVGAVYSGAVRYEGNFNNIGFAVGGGYTLADVEADTNGSSEDGEEWNLGADFDIGAFGVGAAYKNVNGTTDGDSDEIDTYVVGADYTTGPFQFGASYLNSEVDGGQEQDRYTGGVVYTLTQGLTLRGSVSYSDFDNAGTDADATSVLGGVQFNF
jgi:predicted porin